VVDVTNGVQIVEKPVGEILGLAEKAS